MPLHGVVAVLKPAGVSSHAVCSAIRTLLQRSMRPHLPNTSTAPLVATVEPLQPGGKPPTATRSRRRRGRGRKHLWKVGHGGTLDPFATGVLVLGLGSGTKWLQSFLQGDKEYRVTAHLGVATNTYDLTGERTHESQQAAALVREEDVRHVLPRFCGEILQRPPVFSAIRQQGKRYYELARAGEEVERPPARPVQVHELELEDWQPPEMQLRVACGGGFYVRSLVHDMALELGTHAHVSALHRTRQGVFDESMALPEEEWTMEALAERLVRSPEELSIKAAK